MARPGDQRRRGGLHEPLPQTQDPTSGANLQVEDIHALSFDFLLASGSCTSGGLRAQIGLNSTGTGSTKDRTVFVRPPASPCTLGAWRHHDLLATGSWGAAQLGGASTGLTQAQVQALAGAAHRVVTFNMIYDGAPAGSEGWFDNVRFNDAIYREQADEACLDPQSPNCLDADARAGTVIDAAGAAAATVRITADGVALRGFTIRNSGATGAAQGIRISGADALVEGNAIEGNPAAALAGAAQIGISLLSPSYTIRDNEITRWAHSGIYTSLDAPGAASIEGNTITFQGVNAILVEGSNAAASLSIVDNDLRQARNANARLNTTALVELHENRFGISQFTIDLFRFGYSGVSIDASRNHWGAFDRDSIEATIGDLHLADVDVSCYYLEDETTTICPPTAGFTAVPGSPHIHTQVAFTDQSSSGGNPIASWSWDFGDGALSSAQSPTHAYANNGVYTVTLTVADDEGFTHSASASIAVDNVAPVLAAIGSRSGSEGAALSFVVSATDADGDAIAYGMSGAPAGATLHPTSGAFSWTPTYAQSGLYHVVFTATDGDLTASETVAISVADVDRAPTIAPIAALTLRNGQTATTNVQAVDPDGHAIALAAVGLPAYGAFTDLGGGSGTIAWSPTSSHAGTAFVTLEATANGLTTTAAFTVTVVREARIGLERVTPALVSVSPGTVTLVATLTNLGDVAETFTFATDAPAAWGATVPADVVLAPGGSASASVSFSMPANAPVRALTLTAASTATSLGAKTVSWTIVEPLVITIRTDELSYTIRDNVAGVVRVTYLDGTSAAGMPVQLTQTPAGFPALASGLSGTTDASGEFAFDFGTDLRSRLPGEHVLRASVQKPEPYQGTGRYAVD